EGERGYIVRGRKEGVIVADFAIYLVPPHKMINAERNQRPDKPNQEWVSPFPAQTTARGRRRCRHLRCWLGRHSFPLTPSLTPSRRLRACRCRDEPPDEGGRRIGRWTDTPPHPSRPTSSGAAGPVHITDTT